MSEDNPFRIFVAHLFQEDADYTRVFEYLESSTNFFYTNCSDPNNVPSAGGKEALKEELRSQIEKAEVMILPSSMYVRDIDWIRYQMIAAQAAKIPIVALEPFGGVEKMHPDVANRADDKIIWNERMMVDAIRHRARGEDTKRFETIEFEMP
ncbi:MAG TPA: hypothetical protein VIV14_03500 [Gammaproteobacteria bacterium]